MEDNNSNMNLPLDRLQDGSARVIGPEKMLNGENGVFISVEEEFEKRGSILFYFVIIVFMPCTFVLSLFELGTKMNLSEQIWSVGTSVVENFNKKGRNGFYRFQKDRQDELMVIIDTYGFRFKNNSLEAWLDFTNVSNLRSGLFPTSTWDFQVRNAAGGNWFGARLENGCFTFNGVKYTRLNEFESKAEMVTRSSVFQKFTELYTQHRNGAIFPTELESCITRMASSLNASYEKDLKYIKCPGLLDAPGVNEFGRSDYGMSKTAQIAIMTKDEQQRHLCLQNIESYNESQLRSMHQFVKTEKLNQRVDKMQTTVENFTSDGHSTNDSDSLNIDLPPIPPIPTRNQAQDDNQFGGFQQNMGFTGFNKQWQNQAQDDKQFGGYQQKMGFTGFNKQFSVGYGGFGNTCNDGSKMDFEWCGGAN